MNGQYDDIIDLPHHTSPTRGRMSMTDRAAQFSPFAALTGYDAAIRETARFTDEPMEPDDSRNAMLDEQLRSIAQRIGQRPETAITYFKPDERKIGGEYITVKGIVWKIDLNKRIIILENGTAIFMDQIYEIR